MEGLLSAEVWPQVERGRVNRGFARWAGPRFRVESFQPSSIQYRYAT
jgi:hypothetical protein